MMFRWVSTGSIVAAIACATAVAQPTSVPPPTGPQSVAVPSESLEVDDCTPSPQLPAERLRQLAGEHYDRGDVLYVQGDYVGAVSELVSSYCLIPHYRVLKDIGQAYERQLEYSRAIEYLKRYVAAVPNDAKAAACAPDPKQDKRNVSARIEVLSSLPARIRIATEPSGAEVTLTGKDGLVARGVSIDGGGLVVARAGRYEMTVRKPGFVARTDTVVVEIGKPYSYFFQLQRERGRLTVQVVPGNARLFLDDRFVGIGRYEADLPGDSYTLLVEAPGRIAERRKIEVKPRQTERVVVELSEVPQSGRTQLLIYGGVAGTAALGSAVAGLSEEAVTVGIFGGLLVGSVAGYLAIPERIPLGTSSLAITGSLGGGAIGLLTSTAITDNASYIGPAFTFGTLIGGAAGYYVADTVGMSPGDAALINTGMIWGAAYGGLFSSAFNNPETVSVSLVAGGIGLGVITSGLLVRSFSISRTHAALIDLGGVAGFVLSAAGLSLANPDDDATSERAANFQLVGVTLGLASAALLTRNYDDAPALNVQPSIGRVSAIDGRSTMSLGVTGRF